MERIGVHVRSPACGAALGSARRCVCQARKPLADNSLRPSSIHDGETLMIQLLQRSGQVAAARERANAFLSRFPESPHAEQIRQLATH